MSQALYRKWRPQRWEDVVGQDHIIQTLQNAVAADRVAHAYLFAGPRGTGKTTTARLLAKAVNCLDSALENRPCDQCENCLAVNNARFIDLIEIDAASNTSVDDVRDLRDKINFSPNVGRFKVYIIDEVHMLSTAAFNALLKTLEEPPPHAIFILATTEIHKIPATVLSRCQRHEFRRIPLQEIIFQLRKMAAGEHFVVDEEALQLIARQSTGCMRDAISLLDQLASTDDHISLEMTQQVLGTATNQTVIDLVDCLLAEDSASGLELIHRTLDSGSDPRQFARQIVDYFRSLLLSKMGSADQVDATADVRDRMARHAQMLETRRILELIQAFNQAANELRTGWQPALPLEIAYVTSLSGGEPKNAPPNPVSQNAPEPAALGAVDTGNPEPAPKPKAARRSAKTIESSKDEDAAGPNSASPSSPPVDQESTKVYDIIHDGWKEIVGLVELRNRNTAALLRSCRPVGMRRGVLILGFEGRILKQKMEQGEHLDLTQQVISEQAGKTVIVRCLALKDRQSEIPPDVDIDGMVAAALRDLGGKIVDVQ